MHLPEERIGLARGIRVSKVIQTNRVSSILMGWEQHNLIFQLRSTCVGGRSQVHFGEVCVAEVSGSHMCQNIFV